VSFVVTHKPALWSVLRYFNLQFQITVCVQLTVFLYGMPVRRRSFASGGSHIIVFVSLLSYIQAFPYSLFHNDAFHLHDIAVLTEDKRRFT